MLLARFPYVHGESWGIQTHPDSPPYVFPMYTGRAGWVRRERWEKASFPYVHRESWFHGCEEGQSRAPNARGLGFSGVKPARKPNPNLLTKFSGFPTRVGT